MSGTWMKFYEEFADKLITYKDNREDLINIIKDVYQTCQINIPTLSGSTIIDDIDPFTVYGLFNKHLTEDNRKKIIRGFKYKLDIAADVPADFDGVPVLNNMKATYYPFGRGKKQNIQNLWDFFVIAYELAEGDETKRESFHELYDKVIEQYGVKWNLSIGLYWMRPNYYLALDSRNRWFLGLEDYFPSDFINEHKNLFKENATLPNGEYYLSLMDELKEKIGDDSLDYKSLCDLSFDAWNVSNKVNEELKKEKQNDDIDTDKKHYWVYSPGENACLWKECYQKEIMILGWGKVGYVSSLATKDELKDRLREVYNSDASFKNAGHAVWQFAMDINIGDEIIVKKGTSQIVGRGIVESDYIYDNTQPEDYYHVRRVKWINKGEWDYPGKAPVKTLTDITPYTDLVSKIEALFETEGTINEPETDMNLKPYSKEKFLERVYMSSSDYDKVVRLLKRKKNLILEGAPGVGKSYCAQRLAYSMMGCVDTDRVEMVQFHQSYSYEDFIMGYRPTETGFELHKGVFYDFCKKAEDDSDNDYFFIIDEINRGNISKIFGELFILIEEDKRDKPVRLLYSNELFNVPSNVYIIGMMNTADRSLAILDYALRRRFAFYNLAPAFKNERFKEYASALHNDHFDSLISSVISLNAEIALDDSLGKGFEIGHSYFCNLTEAETDDDVLSDIIEYELVPLLKEYWFDDNKKVEKWTNLLRGSIK